MARTPKKIRTDNASKSKQPARPKKVSNPASTGGRGGTFERRVQAIRLLAMCLGIPCAGVKDHFTIVSLLFQGRLQGHNTDDLVVFTARKGTEQKARHNLQMKRSLRATDNTLFNETVGLAWLDFKRAEFTRGMDENLIVYDTASSASMKGAVEVTGFALASRDAGSWYERVHADGFSNASNRNAYSAIKQAVDEYNQEPVEPSELYQFVRHLRFIGHDMDSERAAGVADQKQLIRQGLPWKDPDAVWAQLMSLCAELNGVAGEIDLSTLDGYLPDLAEDFKTFRTLHASIAEAQTGTLICNPDMQRRLKPLADTLATLFTDRLVISSTLAVSGDVPASQPSSVDSLFSRQLDRVKTLHNDRRYSEALAMLETLQDDLNSFDEHQKARWYFLRGMCNWHITDDESAASDLETAYSLHTEDDRIAAGAVRAYLLRNQVAQALELGKELTVKFPDSFAIWQVVTNARVMNGEIIDEADIPGAFRDKSSTWQILASSLAQANDDEGAVRAVKTAIEQADASIFVLENYLRMVLRLATQNALHVENRWQPQDRRDLLDSAIALFDDREAVLWSEQSLKVKSEIVFHLAYCYLLLAKPEQALNLIDQGRLRGVPDQEGTIRFELEALIDLGRQEEAVARYSEKISILSTEALMTLGQACLSINRVALMRRLVAESSHRMQACNETHKQLAEHVNSVLQHLLWELLLREKQFKSVREELTKLGVTPEGTSIARLVFAARAYADQPEVYKQYVDRVAYLALEASTPPDLALASQLMLTSHRFDDAIGILEKLLPSDVFTPLHVDLIYCYSSLDQRAKLRDLLQSLPDDWRNLKDVRQAALHIYSVAGDWVRMRPLVEQEVADNPDAAAWLLLIQVCANLSSEDMLAQVTRLPTTLRGSTADLLRLGAIEINYGYTEKGLERIYRAMRCSAGDLEAAALHLSCMIVSTDTSQRTLQEPEEVGPGTSVELEDSNGADGYITIDLEISDTLPSSPEFISPSSEKAVGLMGLKVGQSISIENLIGVQTFTVKRILSIHYRLIELSKKLVSTSVIQSKTLTSMTIPHDENGNMDVSFFIRQLEQRQTHGENMLGLYEQHPATIGLAAQLIGVDVIDLIRGWPLDGPGLETTFERGVPQNPFTENTAESVWVADLSILVELAALGLLDVLERLPKVYVSSITKQSLAAKIEKLSQYREGGTMYTHEGKIGIRRQTQEDWQNEKTFLHSIELAIDSYCEVVPAYGSTSSSHLFAAKEILSDQEYATLLVCMEYCGGLLSLDGRLRLLANSLEIKTASLQMLLAQAVQGGWLTRFEYSIAIIKQIVARRKFISINAGDLVVMMDQGPDFATAGINSLRGYLADPLISFGTCVPVITDFISWMFNSGRCDMGVALELIGYCFEGMFRHPSCPSNWDVLGFQLLLVKLMPAKVSGLTGSAIQFKIMLAKDLAARPIKLVSFPFHVVYGARMPYYVTTAPEKLAVELIRGSCSVPVSSVGDETQACVED